MVTGFAPSPEGLRAIVDSITPEQRARLQVVADRLASRLGTDTTTAFERLAEGIGKSATSPILANLGVTVSVGPIARAVWIEAGHPHRPWPRFRKLAPRRLPRRKRKAWIARETRRLAPEVRERFRRAALAAARGDA